MKRIKKYYGLILAAVFIATPFINAGIALAIDAPDSTPLVENIKANTYLIEEGDILVYGDYNIPYTTVPSVAADEAYSFVLLDGTDELGSVTPYVLMDSGYNKGVFGFYFTAADAPDWSESYTIRILQNPAHFASPTFYDYVLPLSIWTTSTTQDDNRAELTINLIAAMQRLESYYTDDYSFLDSSVGGTVLSSPTGETYLRGAIYGIQAMAPDLFIVQVLEIDTSAYDWDRDDDSSNMTQSDNYSARITGSWAEPEDTDAQFGLSTVAIIGLIFTFPVCIGFIIVSTMRFRKAEPGLISASLVLELALLMGWMPAALFATLFQVMGVYLSYVWFYARG